MTATEAIVCIVCGERVEDEILLEYCWGCGERFHFNPTNGPGKDCGLCKTCQGGACANAPDDFADDQCPTNACHAGAQSCSPTITCADTGRNLVNGTSCGTNMVCNNGACNACTAGASCQPANHCKTGANSCVTGVPVCAETGNVANGTMCGNNQVCKDGMCVPCTAGGACTPSNPCHNGTQICTTGSPTCQDSGTSLPNGTSCGTNQVCSVGSCVPCTAGKARGGSI